VKQQLEAAHRDVVTVAADLQRNMRDIQVRLRERGGEDGEGGVGTCRHTQ